MSNEPKKLYLECTYTHFSILNTGIQRVVRQLVTHLPNAASEYNFEVHPVVLQDKNFIELQEMNSVQANLTKHKKKLCSRALRRIYYISRKAISILLPHPKIKDFLFAHRNEFGLNYLIDQTIGHGLRRAKSLFTSPHTTSKAEDGQQLINGKEGDILLLLDASWHMDIWKAVEDIQKQGVRLVVITYDLIPTLHPHLLDDALVRVFNTWFHQVALHCDGCIAISKTVQKEVEKQLVEELEMEQTDKFTDHFTLGADFLKIDSSGGKVRKQLVQMFTAARSDKADKNTYLSVGTLEPRKNHIYLLQAFDRLWDSGYNINLCLVGKCGWAHNDIVSAIQSHHLYRKNLFLWDDLNDNELAYCYQNSRMLLLASHAEGFGLPIIEGLHFGLPVMASDIPVHKEVGRNQIEYFSLSNPDELVRKIAKYEKLPQGEGKKPGEVLKWGNWEQSAHSLMQAITRFDMASSGKFKKNTEVAENCRG